MVLSIIHYGFATVSVISFICAFTILHRYLKNRNMLALSFFAFMISLALDTLFFLLRGFYEIGAPEEIFLWQLTNVMYVFMTLPLTGFLLYPLYIKAKGTQKGMGIIIIMCIFIAISIFNLVMISISDIVPTYVDPYGLSHYRLESFIPQTYYLTLGIVIFMGLFSAFLLGVMGYRETETFYRNRAYLIMAGWITAIIGQVILLSPILAIANPLITVIGTLVIAGGVLRSPPS